jgi:hypothetical protein
VSDVDSHARDCARPAYTIRTNASARHDPTPRLNARLSQDLGCGETPLQREPQPLSREDPPAPRTALVDGDSISATSSMSVAEYQVVSTAGQGSTTKSGIGSRFSPNRTLTPGSGSVPSASRGAQASWTFAVIADEPTPGRGSGSPP